MGTWRDHVVAPTKGDQGEPGPPPAQPGRGEDFGWVLGPVPITQSLMSCTPFRDPPCSSALFLRTAPPFCVWGLTWAQQSIWGLTAWGPGGREHLGKVREEKDHPGKTGKWKGQGLLSCIIALEPGEAQRGPARR